MSGAEAIIGVVSAGVGFVSLGIQLGESAVKLKRIFSTAKNASQTISRHVFGLETMALALQELEQHRQHDTHSRALLARCIMQCRQSTFQIQQLVDKMEHYMSIHSKIGGKLYVVYKEQEVKELFDGLEREKSSLELAYIIYLDAEQRRRDQAHDDKLALHSTLLSGLQAQVLAGNADISQQITGVLQYLTIPQQTQLVVSNSHAAIASEPALTGEVTTNMGEMFSCRDDLKQRSRPLPARQARRKKSKEHIRIRLPSRLCSRIWEFAITTAQSRWSMCLYTYNVVPQNSHIFRYCELGNVAAIQRLLKSGEGSLLDTRPLEFYDGNLTLLETAAQYGQLEVCRYLLSQTDWPDHAAVLSRALSLFTAWNNSEIAVEMYRLFLQAPGFDADLEDTEFRYRWLYDCRHGQCLYLILENLHPRFFSLPVEARFDFAVKVGLGSTSIKPSDFLKCIGLQQSDRRLASLRSSDGTSVLHYIARILRNLAALSFLEDKLLGWFDLGLNVLKNGADPSCIARRNNPWTIGRLCDIDPHFPSQTEEEWQNTPLMDALDLEAWEIPGYSTHFRASILRTIQIWAELLQQAGLDLCDCGDKESQVWKSLDIEDFSKNPQNGRLYCNAQVGKLIYGSTPADWSLMIHCPIRIPLFKLHPPPGTFPEKCYLPTTIIWDPTEEERNEGPWEIAETRRIQPKHLDLRDHVVESKEPFEEFINGVQDDLGAVMLMHHRASRPRCSTLRSYSQPRYMDHREVAYGEMKEPEAARAWLGTYHLCPFDSQWRLGFTMRDIKDEIYMNGCFGNPRHCAKGRLNERHSVQESFTWRDYSYLGDIAGCQDKYDQRSSYLPRSMRHNGTRSCPQGCGKVHLDRIQVPEALRRFHPRPIYGEDLETGDDDYEET